MTPDRIQQWIFELRLSATQAPLGHLYGGAIRQQQYYAVAALRNSDVIILVRHVAKLYETGASACNEVS